MNSIFPLRKYDGFFFSYKEWSPEERPRNLSSIVEGSCGNDHRLFRNKNLKLYFLDVYISQSKFTLSSPNFHSQLLSKACVLKVYM